MRPSRRYPAKGILPKWLMTLYYPSFEAIPSDPSKTVTTRHSTYEGWIPGVAQTDLTRDECTALMGHLGFESDGDGAWKKALPDGTTMRVTALPGSSRFYFRGIPRR